MPGWVPLWRKFLPNNPTEVVGCTNAAAKVYLPPMTIGNIGLHVDTHQQLHFPRNGPGLR